MPGDVPGDESDGDGGAVEAIVPRLPPVGDARPCSAMAPHSLDTHERLAARTRALRPPVPVRLGAPVAAGDTTGDPAPLGALIALPARAVGELPAIRTLDGDGRVRAGALCAACGWPPGPVRLSVALDAAAGWAWLAPTGEPACRSHAKLDAHGRIGLPAALRAWLGVEAGGDVVLRADPSTARIGVAHPGLLLRALQALEILEAMHAARRSAPSHTTTAAASEERTHDRR